MSDLFDIAPVVESIDIRGVTLDVSGIAVGDIPYLAGRFVLLRDLVSKGDFTLEKLASVAPDALAAFLACGIGKRGDEKAEKFIAANFKLGDQAELFVKIVKVSFPGGLGPFVESLKAMGLLNTSAPGKPSPSSKKAEASSKSSRKPSTSSSANGATPTPSGDSRPDNSQATSSDSGAGSADFALKN